MAASAVVAADDGAMVAAEHTATIDRPAVDVFTYLADATNDPRSAPTSSSIVRGPRITEVMAGWAATNATANRRRPRPPVKSQQPHHAGEKFAGPGVDVYRSTDSALLVFARIQALETIRNLRNLAHRAGSNRHNELFRPIGIQHPAETSR